ncbi:MAG: hypothetical protein GEV06_03250 [Luteitalea sp.]|nr:hypothetical protein [Luteitalea sp.]
MPPNQVEHDPAVDVARGLTGRDVKIGQIDLAHVGSAISVQAIVREENYSTPVEVGECLGVRGVYWALERCVATDSWCGREVAVEIAVSLGNTGLRCRIAAMSSVDTLKRVLGAMSGVRLAVLFGSAARRTAGLASDLDVGILLDRKTEPTSLLAVTLERAVGRPVDVIWLDAAPPLLRFEIARDGVVLVERSSHTWADFRAHAMIDWWDWAPTARMMHKVMAARLKEEAARGRS